MKTAARQYKREWEEAQLLQLIQLTEKFLKTFNLGLKVFKKILNLTLFISYLLLRFAWNILAIAFFTQPYNQLIRDEQWIYRQIK